MNSLAHIDEHMEVVGSDGHHLGKVDHVDDKVHLNLTRDEAKTSWREKR